MPALLVPSGFKTRQHPRRHIAVFVVALLLAFLAGQLRRGRAALTRATAAELALLDIRVPPLRAHLDLVRHEDLVQVEVFEDRPEGRDRGAQDRRIDFQAREDEDRGCVPARVEDWVGPRAVNGEAKEADGAEDCDAVLGCC